MSACEDGVSSWAGVECSVQVISFAATALTFYSFLGGTVLVKHAQYHRIPHKLRALVFFTPFYFLLFVLVRLYRLVRETPSH